MRLKEEMKAHELDGCSFQPKINAYKRADSAVSTVREKNEAPVKKHAKVSTVESTSDRCKYLYELAKKATKNEHSPEKVEDSTFSPDIRRLNIKDSPLEVSKLAVDKEVERMRKANQERKRVESALSRFEDSTGMRFYLQGDKYRGDFQQFHNPQKRLRSSYSVKKLDRDYKKLIEEAKADVSEANSNLNSDIKVGLNSPEIPKEGKKMKGRRKSQMESREILVDVKFKDRRKRLVIREGTDINQLVEDVALENSILLV